MNNAYVKREPRTCIYQMPAEAAREMYKTRNSSDKGTPFMKYLLEVAQQSNLRWPISKIELV